MCGRQDARGVNRAVQRTSGLKVLHCCRQLVELPSSATLQILPEQMVPPILLLAMCARCEAQKKNPAKKK